jgi:hypothetical protein
MIQFPLFVFKSWFSSHLPNLPKYIPGFPEGLPCDFHLPVGWKVLFHAPASPYSKSESFMRSSDLLLLRHCWGQTRHIHIKIILRLEVGLSYAVIFALILTVVATWTAQGVLRQHPATNPNLRPAITQEQNHRIKKITRTPKQGPIVWKLCWYGCLRAYYFKETAQKLEFCAVWHSWRV